MIGLYIFIFGLIIGSFLNAIIFRLKAGKQFIKGRSKCMSCGHNLKAWDLVPVLSFIFLHAKCRYCQKQISWQYPLVEILTGLAFLIGYIKLGLESKVFYQGFLIANFNLLAFFIFASFLIIILVYDLRYYLILDKVSLSAFVVALGCNSLIGKDILNLLLASAIVAGFFLLQFLVSKGRWIGGGDIRLGLVMGAMLGWPQVLVSLFLAYILGALTGVVLLFLKKKKWSSEMPFGSFLAFTTLITLLYGQEIINWYFRFY